MGSLGVSTSYFFWYLFFCFSFISVFFLVFSCPVFVFTLFLLGLSRFFLSSRPRSIGLVLRGTVENRSVNDNASRCIHIFFNHPQELIGGVMNHTG